MRVQLGRGIVSRASFVFALLLAATLLSGCHETSATSAAGTSATAAGGESAESSPVTTSPATSTAATQPQSSAAQPTDRSAEVSWTPPTTNTNGSALTDLAGYVIHYGTSPNALNQAIEVQDAGATQYVIQGLGQGTWYFAVAAYTNTGLQSSFSSVVSKTIT